jgi:hypothetical protein
MSKRVVNSSGALQLNREITQIQFVKLPGKGSKNKFKTKMTQSRRATSPSVLTIFPIESNRCKVSKLLASS